MAFASSPTLLSPSRRLGFRRKMVDWRVVGFTALSGVMFVAMLARPV